MQAWTAEPKDEAIDNERVKELEWDTERGPSSNEWDCHVMQSD